MEGVISRLTRLPRGTPTHSHEIGQPIGPIQRKRSGIEGIRVLHRFF